METGHSRDIPLLLFFTRSNFVSLRATKKYVKTKNNNKVSDVLLTVCVVCTGAHFHLFLFFFHHPNPNLSTFTRFIKAKSDNNPCPVLPLPHPAHDHTRTLLDRRAPHVMFSLTTAASSLVPNPVRDARHVGRRASHRREAVAFFDQFFPKKEKKKKQKKQKNPPKGQIKPPPPPRADWKDKFDKAIELYSIDEVALECSFMDDAGGCGEAVYAALDALGTHVDAGEVGRRGRGSFSSLFFFLSPAIN